MELESVIPDEQRPPTSTMEWLYSNQLTSSCGNALSSFYSASRDYNRATQLTIGGVESVVTYAAGTAKPVYEKVVEKLDTPLTVVDKAVVGQLEKLEEKYPIIGEEPSTIATKSKESLYSTLQAGQKVLGNTRAARVMGYGADLTLTATESIVEKVLPEVEDTDEDDTSDNEDDGVCDNNGEKQSEGSSGLRKRKSTARKENGADDNTVQDEVRSYEAEPIGRGTRVKQISQTIGSRGLRRLRRVQKQCMSSLKKLKTSIDVLYYTQLASTKVGEQKEVVLQTLKEAEATFKGFWNKQSNKEKEVVESVGGEDDDEDIKWLLESGQKKDVYHRALAYAQGISKKIYDMMQSVNGVASYLPQRLREQADGAVKQAHDVYSTLKNNNVPSELPWFVLTQVSEVIGTQIVYCKDLGAHISTTLKTRFGHGCSGVAVKDEVEVNEDDDKEIDEGEIDSGSETFD